MASGGRGHSAHPGRPHLRRVALDRGAAIEDVARQGPSRVLDDRRGDGCGGLDTLTHRTLTGWLRACVETYTSRVMWRATIAEVRVTVQWGVIMYFGVLAWALNALVMPWALDEHVTLRRRHIVIHVVRHAPVFVQYSATLAVVLGLIVTTIAHEAGHVMMLRRSGASHLEVALTWVGGMGRGLAIDTSPLATVRYAAGGPLASFAVG